MKNGVCPKCKSYLTVYENKKSLTYKCSNKDCDFTKQESREDNE